MTQDTSNLVSSSAWHSVLHKMGIHPTLLLGYVGLLIFMIGDGVESNYLAPFLVDHGLTTQSAATAMAFYGLTVAIGAWLSGTMSMIFGPLCVMKCGAVLWVVMEAVFLTVGVPTGELVPILLTYGLRGIAFPLFAYSFLTWINRATPQAEKARSVGWFWFAFGAGLLTLGSLLASVTIPIIGQYGTLWLSTGLVAVGAGIAIFGIRDRLHSGPSAAPGSNRLREMYRGIDILWRQPKMAAGMVARIFSTAPGYAMFILLPIVFINEIGFTLQEVLILGSCIGVLNIFANVVAGYLADKVGWRRTTVWVGCIGSAVSAVLMYAGPLWAGPNMLVAALCCMFFGLTMAGYSPFTVLMPACARSAEDEDNALAIYTLGAGLSGFAGPALVAIFFNSIGFGGLMIIFVLMHLINVLIISRFRTDEDPQEVRKKRRDGHTPVPTASRNEFNLPV